MIKYKKKRSCIRKIIKKIRNYNTNVYVISYPKAGRTWLRYMLSKVISDYYNVEFSLETFAQTRKIKKCPNIKFHHGNYLKENFSTDSIKNKKRKIFILLVRDPRDIVVSSYFQQSKRDKTYNGDISSFLKDEKFGIHKIVNFYNYWFDQRLKFKNYKIISYEDIKRDTFSAMRIFLDIMGLKDVESNIIDEAIEFSKFEKMRKIERQNKLDNTRLRPGDVKDKESYKVRKGKVGGFVDYLSPTDTEYANEQTKHLVDYYGYK